MLSNITWCFYVKICSCKLSTFFIWSNNVDYQRILMLMFRFSAALHCDSFNPTSTQPSCVWYTSQKSGWKREDRITKKALVLRLRRKQDKTNFRETGLHWNCTEMKICLTAARRCWLASMITPVQLTVPIKSVQNSSSMWPLSFHVCIKLNSICPAYSTHDALCWMCCTHDKERITSTCITGIEESKYKSTKSQVNKHL